jgi:hypothetical protein
LQQQLRDELPGTAVTDDAGAVIARYLASQRGYPVVFTEPRYTTIGLEGAEGLQATVERLVDRIVRPKRRGGGGGGRPVDALARQLRPWLQRRVIARRHVFTRSRSGVPRSVDFFANSTANVALDALNLAIQRADEIRLRCDAEAFKVEDIKGSNELREYVVFCEFHQEPEFADVNLVARRVLESAGATVEESVEAAASVVAEAVQSRGELLTLFPS